MIQYHIQCFFSSLLDQEQHASWIETAKSCKESSCTLRNDDEHEIFSPTLRLCSEQERNLLSRLEDMMASISPLINQGNELSGEISVLNKARQVKTVAASS